MINLLEMYLRIPKTAVDPRELSLIALKRNKNPMRAKRTYRISNDFFLGNFSMTISLYSLNDTESDIA